MSIDGAKNLSDWGRYTPVNDSGSIHITQTSDKAVIGEGAHITTQVQGESFHDYFDSQGNYKSSDY